MATKTVHIQLTLVGASIGASFDIYDDSATLPGIVRCAGVPTADLQAGYDCTNIQDDATKVILMEVDGVCDKELELTIVECSTTTTSTTIEPTTTTTTTTTIEPTTTTTTSTTCEPATIIWYVGQGLTCNLTINSEEENIIDIDSIYDGPQTGQIDCCSGVYSIIGSWRSGSGNIVQMRICDGEGEVFYDSSITNADPTATYITGDMPSENNLYYIYITNYDTVPTVCFIPPL